MTVAHSSPHTVASNGIELCYDTFGSPEAEPMLLVMGLGATMHAWDPKFCSDLAERGFYVIRFDNRDVGKSTHVGGGSRLRLLELLRLRLFGTPVAASYKLRDMAEDTAGLLDALGLTSAHVVGVSMGGMISQELTLLHPDRVRSLTSIMSTTGDPKLPGPTREAQAVLVSAPPKTRAEYIEHFGRMWRVLRVGSFPLDEARDQERAEASYAYGLDPAGVGRQLRAIFASGSREARLGAVRVPTLVIHGTVDPLIRSAAGRATAAAIPGARLLEIEGMGHAMPISMWPQLVAAIADHAQAARG